MKLRWILGLGIGLLFLSGCDKGLDSDGLPLPEDEEVGTTTAYPGIMRMLFPKTCTVTAIHPRIALTAAHCVLPIDTLGGKIAIRNSSGAIVEAADKRTLGNGSEFDTSDLALVSFGEDVASESEIFEIGTKAERLNSVTLVGYGCTQQGTTKGMGIKRRGTNVIFSVGAFIELHTPIIPLRPAREETVNSLLGPRNRAGSCSGDSGGPLLLYEGDLAYVIGVNHSALPDGNQSQLTQYSNLLTAAHQQFLAQAATELGVSEKVPESPFPTHPVYCQINSGS